MFHEAGHAVTGLALGHGLERIRIQPPDGTYPGRTYGVPGPSKASALFDEECIVVKMIGGIAEAKHDSQWTPIPGTRRDDLTDVTDLLRAGGSGPQQIAAVLKKADELCWEILKCEALWVGITAVAEYMERLFMARPTMAHLFPGPNIIGVAYKAAPEPQLSACGSRIRSHLATLRSLR